MARRARVAGSLAAVVLAASSTAACTTTGPGAGTTPSRSVEVTGSTASTAPAPKPKKLAIHVSAVPWRLPGPVAREAAVVVGKRVLVAGGLVPGDTTTANTYWLRPRTGRTARLGSLSLPVHDTGGGLPADGGPLVIGGGSSTSLDVVQQLDPSTGQWSVIGHLPTPRSDLSAESLDGSVYVIGGYTGSDAAEADILKSTTGTSWTTKAQLRDPVRYAATAIVGHVLWVFGGERSGVTHDGVQRVNLRTGKSRVVAHLPQPLGEAMAIPVGRVILLCGGRTGAGSVSRACRWFDPSKKQLIRAGRLPWPLADSAPVTVGSTIYLLGGETPTVSDRVIQIKVTGQVL